MFLTNDVNTIGVIFCHVMRTKQFIHDNPFITLGSQK